LDRPRIEIGEDRRVVHAEGQHAGLDLGGIAVAVIDDQRERLGCVVDRSSMPA
jgi:hypothetical protein